MFTTAKLQNKIQIHKTFCDICDKQWHIKEEKELFFQKICRYEFFCVLLLRVFCTV